MVDKKLRKVLEEAGFISSYSMLGITSNCNLKSVERVSGLLHALIEHLQLEIANEGRPIITFKEKIQK